MANFPENVIDFRAPPPSPVASGRRSSLTKDHVITEFLQLSLSVPDLILPDKFFPKQKSVEDPPAINFEALCSDHYDDHSNVTKADASRIFHVPPAKRADITRSSEKPYGFEELHGEEAETELSEEFVWCREQGLKLAMQGIWSNGYSNFSKKLESLMTDIEQICERTLQILFNINSQKQVVYGNDLVQGKELGTVCCFYKHNQNVLADKWDSYLRHDVIRMLIRGTDYSHALCLHLCDGSSEFHVYSKKGWVSFSPEKDALVVTTGDQIQARSRSQYKHVIGRPIFKGGKEECISMAFLYSPPSILSKNCQTNRGKIISIGEQVIVAIFLILVYQFSMYCFYRNG